MSGAVYIEPSRRLIVVPVTIASGQALSAAVPLLGYTLKGIIMPSAWTAAAITFQMSDKESGTYVDVFDDGGTEVSLTVAASRYVGVGAGGGRNYVIGGIPFLKVRSGPSAAPVNQLADRALLLVLGVNLT